MAKKAKLDILEITIDEKNEVKLHDDIILDLTEDVESAEKRVSPNILLKVKQWGRKPLFWIVLISTIILGSTVGVLISLNEGIDEKGRVERNRGIVSSIPLPEQMKVALFDGFVIDQKDDKNNIRIVFCDVALELDKPMTGKIVDTDRNDVRDVIYTLLKQETLKETLSTEGKNRLKERLKNELNNLLGEKLVKDIYVTRYEVN